MLSGSSRRLTCVIFLALVLLAPLGASRPPAPNRDAPEGTGGQDITDLGLDASGRFATAVVVYDAAKLNTNPGGILGGGSSSTTKRDVYVCDLGPVSQPRAGAGCRGINHGGTNAQANGATQAVDVVSYQGTSGLVSVYVVAGPGEMVSFFAQSSDTARWSHKLGAPVVNASISPDGSRVVAAVAPTGVNAQGRIVLYDTEGRYRWEYNLTDAQGTPAKPTSLAFSRDGRVLAVGTTRGVLFFDPQGNKPTRLADLGPLDTNAVPVVKVALSRNGDAVVVGTADGLYYAPLVELRPTTGSVWNRGVSGGVTDVAMSLDGKRFAAASGSRITFYRAIGGVLLAEQVPDSHDAGATVADLAYDANGELLLAVAGDTVLGFGPTRHTPLWTFKATEAARGGLDAPLRKVAVSDAGDRIVVAGRTKFMAYTSQASATAAFGSGPAPTVLPSTPLQLGFTLTNTGSLPDNYTAVVKRPVGWTGSNPDNVALDPDASAVLNLTVEAPAGTAPGLYPLQVEVRSRVTGGVVANAFINLSLPRSVVLTVETTEDTILLDPASGRERTVPVTIRNNGNAEGVVNVSVEQSVSRGASWPIRLDEQQVRIPAGGEADVEMIVAAPADSASGTRNVVTLVATEGSESRATRVVTAYVDGKFGAELTASNASLEFRPGESRTLTVTLRNTGNTDDTFNVTYALTPNLARDDWKVTLAEDLKVSLAQGASRTISIAIRPGAAEPRDATLTIRAVSQSDPGNAERTTDVLLTSRPADDEDDAPGGGGDDKSLLPGPALPAVLAALVLAGILLRRGGKR